MEGLLVLSYVVVGGAIGAGADWLFWKRKFRQAGAQANARGETLQRQFQEELASKEEELVRQESALAVKEEKLGSHEAELANLRRERQELEQRLREENLKLSRAEVVNARVGELEAALEKKTGLIEGLTKEGSALAARISVLERELEEEKRSVQECLIFVEGTHYLPGKVVRSLTGSKTPEFVTSRSS